MRDETRKRRAATPCVNISKRTRSTQANHVHKNMEKPLNDAGRGEGVEQWKSRRDASGFARTTAVFWERAQLVVHGRLGGNTSAKGTKRDRLGRRARGDLREGLGGPEFGTLECRRGNQAVRPQPLTLICRALASMTDEDMWRSSRRDDRSSARDASVETLLHASCRRSSWTHARRKRLLALADQPTARSLPAGYGSGLVWVISDDWNSGSRERRPRRLRAAREGRGVIVLSSHGVFTCGETAKERYEKIVRAVRDDGGCARSRTSGPHSDDARRVIVQRDRGAAFFGACVVVLARAKRRRGERGGVFMRARRRGARVLEPRSAESS